MPTRRTRRRCAAILGIRLGCQPRGRRPGIGLCGDSRCRAGMIGLYLWIGLLIGYVESFDIRIITMMRSGWEKTARRPRITRRWWAPLGMQDEENHQS
jgi:hypothetical protein